MNISITSEPKFPEPFTPVTLTLEAYGIPIPDSSINWYIDGKPFSKETRSISLVSKGIASSTHVSAIITQGGEPITVETIINPSVLTILLESSVPTIPFVREKMNIPAATKLTAIAMFDRGIKNEIYDYRWELGEGNNGTTPGQRFSLTMPDYDNFLFVTVTDSQGVVVHEGGVELIPATPKLSIYPYAHNVISPFPLIDTYIPQESTESFLAIIRNATDEPPTWFLSDTPLTAPELPTILTLSELLTADTELRISIPYGPFNTLTAEHAVRITH